jgi:hypothetical protein
VSYSEPLAILEDASNNLLALDGSGTVEAYSEATGKLVQQIPVPNGAAWEAFNQKRSELFVSNFDQVEVLSYPAGKVLGSINEGGTPRTTRPPSLTGRRRRSSNR